MCCQSLLSSCTSHLVYIMPILSARITPLHTYFYAFDDCFTQFIKQTCRILWEIECQFGVLESYDIKHWNIWERFWYHHHTRNARKGTHGIIKKKDRSLLNLYEVTLIVSPQWCCKGLPSLASFWMWMEACFCQTIMISLSHSAMV